MKWFVSGHCDKDENIAYVVNAAQAHGALDAVGCLTGRKVLKVKGRLFLAEMP